MPIVHSPQQDKQQQQNAQDRANRRSARQQAQQKANDKHEHQHEAEQRARQQRQALSTQLAANAGNAILRQIRSVFARVNNVLPQTVPGEEAKPVPQIKDAGTVVNATARAASVVNTGVAAQRAKKQQQKETETKQALTSQQFAEMMKTELAQTQAIGDLDIREALTAITEDVDRASGVVGRIKASTLRARGLNLTAIKAKVLSTTVAKALSMLPIWEKMLLRLRDICREKKAKGEMMPMPRMFREILAQMSFARER